MAVLVTNGSPPNNGGIQSSMSSLAQEPTLRNDSIVVVPPRASGSEQFDALQRLRVPAPERTPDPAEFSKRARPRTHRVLRLPCVASATSRDSGLVDLEAALAELPTIGTRILGLRRCNLIRMKRAPNRGNLGRCARRDHVIACRTRNEPR
jgi:hypothetical protein